VTFDADRLRGLLLSPTGPLARLEVVDEVAVTVIHEIAHHFGIDDARLEELGWD